MNRREFMAQCTITIRILFYKSKWGDGHIIDDVISLYTWLFNWRTKNYSHCEIWVPRENGGQFESLLVDGASITSLDNYTVNLDGTCSATVSMRATVAKYSYWGTCYTSTMRGEANGVVKRPSSGVLKNPGRWDYYEIEITELEYSALIWSMDRDVADNIYWNRGYGKRAIFQFFNPIEKTRIINREYPICSGSVKRWLILCGWVTGKKVMELWKHQLDSPRRLSGRLNKMGLKAKELA